MEDKKEILENIDKDNDGMPDRTERIVDYTLAAIILLVSVPAFYLKMIDFSDLKVVFYLVVGLSGGMTAVKGIIKELLKK